MKKTLITLTTLALLSAGVPRAQAHGGGGGIAAGVVGGIGAGLLLSRVLEPQRVYAAPVYAPTVVVQQPAQVVVQSQLQPVYVQQQPVYVQSPQVVYAPATVVYPAPVYYRPYCAPPVVSFGFSFGHGPSYRHGYRHW